MPKLARSARDVNVPKSDPLRVVREDLKRDGLAFARCHRAVESMSEYIHHINTCPACLKKPHQSESEATQLELYPPLPGHMRAMPTTIARSALFRVGDKRKKREYIDPRHPITIAALKGITITYHGPELHQEQQSVMLELHRLCRADPVAAATDGIPFVPHQILKALKMANNGKNYRWLKLQLDYLSGGAVEVKTATEGWNGKLVRKYQWKEKHKDPAHRAYRAWLEPEMFRLFAQWTGIDFEQRLALHSSLAQAIHSHLSTHDEPYAYSVTKWRELTGSATHALYRFRQSLKRALQELVGVQFLSAWRIDEGDLVHLTLHDRRQLELPEMVRPLR